MANITFNRVGAGSNGAGAYSDNATILLGNYSDTSDASGAFSYYPSPYATAPTQAAGDVWDNAYYNTNIGPAVGNYGWITLIHELGHSIGLEHPGDYNAAPGVRYLLNPGRRRPARVRFAEWLGRHPRRGVRRCR